MDTFFEETDNAPRISGQDTRKNAIADAREEKDFVAKTTTRSAEDMQACTSVIDSFYKDNLQKRLHARLQFINLNNRRNQL